MKTCDRWFTSPMLPKLYILNNDRSRLSTSCEGTLYDVILTPLYVYALPCVHLLDMFFSLLPGCMGIELFLCQQGRLWGRVQAHPAKVSHYLYDLPIRELLPIVNINHTGDRSIERSRCNSWQGLCNFPSVRPPWMWLVLNLPIYLISSGRHGRRAMQVNAEVVLRFTS